MSLAENLLQTLSTDNYNLDSTEAEPHIIVGRDRIISVPNQLKRIAVENDKNIETVTFDCVRYWDGHDLSTFAIYLNYTLPNGVTGTYIPTGIIRSADYYSFDWTIDRMITEVAGSLEIALSAIQTDSNGAVQRQWGSLPNSDMVIAHGLPISNVPNVEEETDILSQALSELIEAKNLIGDIDTALDGILAIQDELIPREITFTMTANYGGSETLTAIKGMTWGEWVNSDYNPGNYQILYGAIYYGVSVISGNGGTLETDVILENGTYTIWN